MTEEEREELRRTAAQARRDRVQAREDAVESSRKGLRALLGERLEARADKLTDRLERLALSEDDATATQGIKLWLERVHGRAVQPTQEVAPSLPADLAALRALTPEERRDLMRSLPPAAEG